ncbi:hypothetical protein EYZ11_012224 [Aspergillus tanneri]|uniref:Uncharacterized protein n=1 Tax=Aspergillus tanneri TaxID=1220188 RepID=A0A4S3J0T9_9EURO|nr:hypothetical protein EYZ11_012224 [Aspergillus tanneri]
MQTIGHEGLRGQYFNI